MSKKTISVRDGVASCYLRRTRRGVEAAVLIGGLLPLALGCGAAPEGSDEVESLGEATQQLFKYTNYVRPGRPTLTINLWPNGIVPICWDSSFTNAPSFGKRAGWIMEFLQDHWAAAANLDFQETGACPSDKTKSKGAIRLVYLGEAEGSGHAGQGYNPENYDTSYCANCASVELNFGPNKSALLQAELLHEFGHALGFQHELERADFTAANVPTEQTTAHHAQGTQCDAVETPGGGIPAAGRTDYTTYDPESIMNFGYCHYRAALSTKDKSGIAAAYGTPGRQQHRTFVRDTGNDQNELRWNGSAWVWTYLGNNDTNTAGSPVVIRNIDQNLVSVFSTSTTSGLLDNFLNGPSWSSSTWSDKALTSNPVAVNYRDYGKDNGKWAEAPLKFRVFATDTTGVVARRYSAGAWAWESFGKPAGVTVQSVAAAVSFRDWGLTEESQYVFVRGTNNKLYILYGTTGAPTAWTGELAAGRGGSPGTALTFLSSWTNAREIWYFTTDNGSLWSYRWNGSAWVWTNHGGANVSGAVTAVTWTDVGERKISVYVVASDGTLRELFLDGSSAAGNWSNFGKPANVGSLDGPSATTARYPGTAPSPFDLTPVTLARSIYVRGSNGKLYWFSTISGTWYDMTTNYGGPSVKQSLYPSTASLSYFSR